MGTDTSWRNCKHGHKSGSFAGALLCLKSRRFGVIYELLDNRTPK
jgi:hypothetical protein